jgi:hypothetical protein
MRVPGKWLPDNREPATVGSIYTVIPGYQNSGRTVRVIGTSEGRNQYDVEDVLTEEVFRINKDQIAGANARKRPDPYRHAGLHAILQVGYYDYDLMRHTVLRNNQKICSNLINIHAETQDPVSWTEGVPTFYVYRSLLQKCEEIEPGQTICMVSDQDITEEDLASLKDLIDLDTETYPQRFIGLGWFPSMDYEPGQNIQFGLSLSEDGQSIISQTIDDGSVRIYSIRNVLHIEGIKVMVMDSMFKNFFL